MEGERLRRHSNRLSMSETVQQSLQEPRGSKFLEGRLKLSTSCTECHRRKQRVRYPSFILCNGWKVTSAEAIDSNTFSATNNIRVDSAPGGTHSQNAFIGT